MAARELRVRLARSMEGRRAKRAQRRSDRRLNALVIVVLVALWIVAVYGWRHVLQTDDATTEVRGVVVTRPPRPTIPAVIPPSTPPPSVDATDPRLAMELLLAASQQTPAAHQRSRRSAHRASVAAPSPTTALTGSFGLPTTTSEP